MDKKTLKALQGSIRKWERIAEGKEVDKGADNCPLCELFYNKICIGCPVEEKVNHVDCRRTPYIGWTEHQKAKHGEESQFAIKCEKCKELAQKEADFLKSLLPKEAKI